jgi:hypothetical protein
MYANIKIYISLTVIQGVGEFLLSGKVLHVAVNFKRKDSPQSDWIMHYIIDLVLGNNGNIIKAALFPCVSTVNIFEVDLNACVHQIKHKTFTHLFVDSVDSYWPCNTYHQKVMAMVTASQMVY